MENMHLECPRGLRRWLQIYRLYRTAFPASERKPFGVIVRMYRRGKTDVWCAVRNGSLCAVATTINSPELILLDYLAVAESCRGQGIGTAVMGQLQTRYGDRGLFVEIESTKEPADNHVQREKRRNFYIAAGMQDLEVTASVFGVNMDLLGSRCRLDFDSYRVFYREHYGAWAAENIKRP